MLFEGLLEIVRDMDVLCEEYALGFRPTVRLGAGLWGQAMAWIESMMVYAPERYHPGGFQIRIAGTLWRRDLTLGLECWSIDMEVRT